MKWNFSNVNSLFLWIAFLSFVIYFMLNHTKILIRFCKLKINELNYTKSKFVVLATFNDGKAIQRFRNN